MWLCSIWRMLKSSGVTLLFHCLPGELQRAHLHAAAAVWGLGVPRAAWQGRQVPQLAGADVLRGCLLCVLILHHCAPHRQALQPAAGRDLRVGPAERERLPLAVWAGQSTPTKHGVNAPGFSRGSRTRVTHCQGLWLETHSAVGWVWFPLLLCFIMFESRQWRVLFQFIVVQIPPCLSFPWPRAQFKIILSKPFAWNHGHPLMCKCM